MPQAPTPEEPTETTSARAEPAVAHEQDLSDTETLDVIDQAG